MIKPAENTNNYLLLDTGNVWTIKKETKFKTVQKN